MSVRVGVLMEAGDACRWHSTAVSEIEGLGFCTVTIFAREPSPGVKATRPGGAARHWLYEAYVRADRRLLGRDDDALARLSPGERCGAESARRVRLDGDWEAAGNIAVIGAEDLDVLLCLAPGVPTDRLAGCARFGAWSLSADSLWGPDADRVASVTLRAHTTKDGERIIYRSVIQSDRISLHRGRCRAARRAAHLAARRIRDLHLHGSPFITSLPVYAERRATAAKGGSRPGNSSMARLLVRVALGVLRRRLAGRLSEKQWFIAYGRVGGDISANGDSASLELIAPPAGRFYADPFLFARDGRRFIFFEDYDGSSRRAVIDYVEIDEDGRHSSPRVVLKQDCHLSYPLVFAEDDSVYMLPETSGRRTVELWRAARFPDEWTLDRVLMKEVTATDATLLWHEGRLWMFVAMALPGDRPLDELFLFSSDSLGGEWEPHPMNPVVSDVRCARPAGRVFLRSGSLIRPGQDCSESYGGRLVFNRIEALSTTEYRETPVGAIEPEPDSGNLRTHSYDSDGTYEVVDGFRMRPRFALRLVSRQPTRPRWHRIDLESPGNGRSVLHS